MSEEKDQVNFDEFVLTQDDFFEEPVEETDKVEDEPQEEEEEKEEEKEKEDNKESQDKEEKGQEKEEESKEEVNLEDLSEEVRDLYEKAEKDIDSLTEEETKILEENNLLESGEEKEEDDGGEASVLPLIEMMHENAGWEFDAEKFKENDSVEGLMEFIGEVINQNSNPEFASDEVAKFNEFVSKHGTEKASEYLSLNYGETDYNQIDLEEPANQQKVYSDYLRKSTNFSEDKIAKEVKRLSDLDELDKEVEDAKNYLIEDAEKRKKDFEAAQEEELKQREENFAKYLDTQKERINSVKEIAGFELDEKDKEGLYKFAFEPDRTGKTEYQKLKDKDKDLDLKLLLLAYKGVDKAKITQDATTQTVKKLKKSLSRFKDNKEVKSSTRSPKKDNPNKDINYNDFVLK